MAYRDIEDLILNTLRINLAEVTGIPSGQIFLKIPALQFFNKMDDTNKSIQMRVIYPAIGINFMRDAVIKYNNYGETKYIRNGGGIATAYEALGEVELLLDVSLFTKSRKDQRDYGIKIEHFFFANKYIGLENDEINGEYMTMCFTKKRDFDETDPFRKAFIVKVNARVLNETSGYIVEEVVTTLETNVESYDVVTEPDIVVTFDSSNPLVVDDQDEFEEGENERTDII